jgi:septum formation protein
LLKAAGLTFEVVPAAVDEAALKRALAIEAQPASAVAGTLAAAKAQSVSARYRQALVIGADQVLVCDGQLYDKPADLAAARLQLQQLRGRDHQLHSAVALAQDRQIVWRYSDSASLRMRHFSDAFLQSYLAQAGDAILGSVGAYQVEGVGIQLFNCMSGDASTIIGLPMLPLLQELRVRGLIGT